MNEVSDSAHKKGGINNHFSMGKNKKNPENYFRIIEKTMTMTTT